ncbi:MAG: BON domain-containing protein [Burkholderiaceae bacterium]
MNLKTGIYGATAMCALALAGSLSGCAPAVLGGVAMSTLVATDRRTSGTQLEDEGIELRSFGRIRSSIGDRANITVTSYNRQVLLTGQIPNAQDKPLVHKIVSGVDNVRAIVNELEVQPNATLTQRSTDALTRGLVKASMIDAKDVFANSFKVVVERGTVYLMGRVTQREADRATEIARGTRGVEKVVRVLEIISEEELKRSMPAPTS